MVSLRESGQEVRAFPGRINKGEVPLKWAVPSSEGAVSCVARLSAHLAGKYLYSMVLLTVPSFTGNRAHILGLPVCTKDQ